ncbi:Fatty acid synthase 3, partial [Carabus blaptoides fortunei]
KYSYVTMVSEADIDVVISGIGGSFPKTNNVEELKHALMEQVDLLGKARWKDGLYDVCDKSGNIDNIANFDASYFGVHQHQATYMDPMQRIVLEKSFEALIDAGINPVEARGKRIGVYMSSTISENDCVIIENIISGFGSIDEVELSALDKVYNKKRNEPLPVGSIKSHTGHSEAASTIFSIVKVILSMENDVIIGHKNYETPNKNIPSLMNGKFEIVTGNKPFEIKLAAVNGVGLTSSYGHILLKSKTPKKTSIQCDIPMLRFLSTRNEEGINEIVELEKSITTLDVEYATLVNNIFSKSIPGHLYRGYVSSGTEVKHAVDHIDGVTRPVWFVYSGMGSQWTSMGKDLMKLPLFAAAIHKCHNILLTKGLDLLNIITTDDKTIFDDILHSFVGIAAIQIGLTDVLHAIGVTPDGIIGHSVGELGCAYADGCLTAEQMILSAYYRGRASQEVTLIPGMMAAIGVGAQDIMKECPPLIDVACHNGPDSCTLSGPKEEMETFVAELQAKDIFAKLVNVSNIAYHSRYIKSAAPLLLDYLKKVL